MRLYNAKDIAEFFKISYDSALVWIKTSGIPYIKVGRQYRVTEVAFLRFIGFDN